MEIIITIVAIIVIWKIAIEIQKAKRIPMANKLISETLEELVVTEFDKLARMIGKGYRHEEREIEGVTYYVGYIVSKPNIVTGIHTSDSAKAATEVKTDEIIDRVEVSGYVDCITIIPIIYCKMGPSYNKIIERNKKTPNE